MEIPAQYNPKEVEDKQYCFWNTKGYFHAEPSAKKQPYTIVIPPPNVTGILHMGHALNNTIQDILIRYKKMQGFNALWVPGTDHAGIATQNVVERELSKEKKTRHDLGRDAFLEKVWQWTEENGGTIIEQLKKLGSSCDWQRKRFTLDDEYSQAVNEVFIRLYREKLIYKGSYIINWCPRCQTALSDEEAAHKDIQGNLYYIKYHLKDSKEFVVAATTRPETMFGDTALAVNPGDERYKYLKGKTAVLPIAGREIEIIEDEMVDPKFGTGIVKVTPLHDHNDFEIGSRHKLKGIFCLNPDGTMNINATENYNGLDRFEAREVLIEDLKERKLLQKIEPHQHSVGHCYRCHTIIEPYFSEQWFVKMKPLSIEALASAQNGKIKFYPERWLKIYINWMENIKDWCISRQIWWGHRIPVWYCEDCCQDHLEKMKTKELRLPIKISDEEAGIIHAGQKKPDSCRYCGSKNIKQDPDVLDTWFSSWLWPFAVLGWPKKTEDLKCFYPTSSLITASEIIFFWVARMIMAGFYFIGEKPFGDICIHATVRDDKGRKMSKSLGNAIDPMEVIDKYGADALRFSLISLPGEDLYLSENKFEFGRNFVNKLWNASRFILMNLDEKKLDDISLEELGGVLDKNDSYLAESWIIGELNQLILDIDKEFKAYRFNEAVNKLYDFFWHKFCDWYIETAKINIQDKVTQNILLITLKTVLKLLHPFIPFITEEIWQNLPFKSEDSIMISSWPKVNKKLIDIKKREKMESIMKLVTRIRDERKKSRFMIMRSALPIRIVTEGKIFGELLTKHKDYIKRLCNFQEVEVGFRNQAADIEESLPLISYARSAGLYFPVLKDIGEEKQDLKKQIEKKERQIRERQGRLENGDFLSKAPKNVIEEQKRKKGQDEAELKSLKEKLETWTW